MLASTVADNVSRSAAPLSLNLSKNPLRLRARARIIASAYTYAADQREIWDTTHRIWDRESGDEGSPRHSVPWQEYYEPPKGVMPIASSPHAVKYQVDLKLNELGSAFMGLDSQLWKGFDDRDIADLDQVNG